MDENTKGTGSMFGKGQLKNGIYQPSLSKSQLDLRLTQDTVGQDEKCGSFAVKDLCFKCCGYIYLAFLKEVAPQIIGICHFE